MKILSVICGLLLLAIGIIPILSGFIQIPIEIVNPIDSLPEIAIQVGLIIGGFYLIYDAANPGLLGTNKTLSFVIGLFVIAIGILPLLMDYNVMPLPLIDILSSFKISLLVYQITLIVVGFFLIIDGFLIRY